MKRLFHKGEPKVGEWLTRTGWRAKYYEVKKIYSCYDRHPIPPYPCPYQYKSLCHSPLRKCLTFEHYPIFMYCAMPKDKWIRKGKK